MFPFGSQTHVTSNKHVVCCMLKLCVTNVGKVRYENEISLFSSTYKCEQLASLLSLCFFCRLSSNKRVHDSIKIYTWN
jgi:hypothetical protein